MQTNGWYQRLETSTLQMSLGSHLTQESVNSLCKFNSPPPSKCVNLYISLYIKKIQKVRYCLFDLQKYPKFN